MWIAAEYSNMARITLKTSAELNLMRESGRLLANVFQYLDSQIQAGMSTLAIDRLTEDYITRELHSRPASKGQYGFEFSLNTSINEVVCHGVPSIKDVLKNGDIINLDITLEKNGFIADSSKMYRIGDISPLAQQLVDTCYEAMWLGIRQVKPGASTGDIGHAIDTFVRRNGFMVVTEYCGHGIGREMHESPEITHYGIRGMGTTLKEGMTFTIEPMVNQGTARVKTLRDGWTVITRDKGLSAQWEHTIAVTRDGFEVLTLRPEEPQEWRYGPA
jgi:methionyl aminopeptidase